MSDPVPYLCERCGEYALFGFGELWACAKHKVEVEAQWLNEKEAK